ncbi:MAG: hypothetical protein JWN33_63 [Candidatus Saccharibacteria bacterium]|nr:hypothetical protein [Candidatus Saccharibacteria bacterium]
MMKAASRKIRVLLVDDDEDDYLIIRQIFSKIPEAPFSLEWSDDYDKAWRLIGQRKHHLYLIDYRLGEKSGMDLMRGMLPQARPEPFIILTGAGDRDLERQAMREGASDYLVKGSFGPELLSRTLQYAIGRKNAEQQRVQYLIELNRSKDEFISIASHQLRTPATGVKQYLGMVLEGFVGEVTDRQRDIIQKAYQSNERQLRIVADLLKVAQVDAGKIRLHKQKVSVGEMLGDIIGEQADTYRMRQQSIRFTSPSKATTAHIDVDAVRMVLENIIDNASKYSSEGTTVNVAVKEDDHSFEITVADQGVGIADDEHAKVFEKFSRIENPLSTKVGGTGLGLYWAKKIVDLHGGSVRFTSEPGDGTTFYITLPK